MAWVADAPLSFLARKKRGNRYGHKIVPRRRALCPGAGHAALQPENLSEEEIVKEKAREKRRSGLLLSDPAVIKAMEHGEVRNTCPSR
jgi:hypothetical protein